MLDDFSFVCIAVVNDAGDVDDGSCCGTGGAGDGNSGSGLGDDFVCQLFVINILIPYFSNER